MRTLPQIGFITRQFRKALGLTQQQVQERSEGVLSREYVAMIETGSSRGRSWKVRSGYAKAFGFDVEHLSKYLEGEIDLKGLFLLSPDFPPSPTESIHLPMILNPAPPRSPVIKALVERLVEQYGASGNVPEGEIVRTIAVAVRLDERRAAEWILATLRFKAHDHHLSAKSSQPARSRPRAALAE
jgi:transcriptional regulator with XRE-family HTH domain